MARMSAAAMELVVPLAARIVEADTVFLQAVSRPA